MPFSCCAKILQLWWKLGFVYLTRPSELELWRIWALEVWAPQGLCVLKVNDFTLPGRLFSYWISAALWLCLCWSWTVAVSERIELAVKHCRAEQGRSVSSSIVGVKIIWAASWFHVWPFITYSLTQLFISCTDGRAESFTSITSVMY